MLIQGSDERRILGIPFDRSICRTQRAVICQVRRRPPPPRPKSDWRARRGSFFPRPALPTLIPLVLRYPRTRSARAGPSVLIKAIEITAGGRVNARPGGEGDSPKRDAGGIDAARSCLRAAVIYSRCASFGKRGSRWYFWAVAVD